MKGLHEVVQGGQGKYCQNIPLYASIQTTSTDECGGGTVVPKCVPVVVAVTLSHKLSG